MSLLSENLNVAPVVLLFTFIKSASVNLYYVYGQTITNVWQIVVGDLLQLTELNIDGSWIEIFITV